MTTLVGVVADTHVPQRLERLPPGIAEAFRGVALVLHAGDINSKQVLQELGRIAPVFAVPGNADPPWWRLPYRRIVRVEGCRIGLAHGHLGWRHYLVDKLRQAVFGFDQARYLRYARESFRDVEVDVVVTGHTHRAHRVYGGGVLLFNPGPVAPDYYNTRGPMVGILSIEDRAVEAKFVPLGGQSAEPELFGV